MEFGGNIIVSWGITCFSDFCNQTSSKKQVKGGVFIFTYWLRECSPPWQKSGGCKSVSQHITLATRKEAERWQKMEPCHSLPVAKCHPPKVPQVSTLSLPFRDQCSNAWTIGGHFTFKSQCIYLNSTLCLHINTRHFS